MSKVGLIISREFKTRISKRVFWVMTLVGPLLMAAVLILPVWLQMRQGNAIQKVMVVDDTYLFKDSLPSNSSVQFQFSNLNLDQAQDLFFHSDFQGILYIPPNIMSGGMSAKLFYKEQLGLATEEYAQHAIEQMIYNFKLQKNNVDLKTLEHARTSIHLITEQIAENGTTHETNTSFQMRLGFALGFFMYLFIFMYGVQVMRGIMEEKSSRIVEVMVSSVKPFQLMLGKIFGIALVGLTQFILWLVLTTAIYTTAQQTIFAGARQEMELKLQEQSAVYQKRANLQVIKAEKPLQYDKKVYQTLESLDQINISHIVFVFLFYFLGGYLLYAALFAIVGAAVDTETDTQQFLLPITIPLILSFLLAQPILMQPNSTLASMVSIFPFTSPVTMLVRLPFGIPTWQLFTSMLVLIIGFLFTTWVAARIYRIGILLYGKKPTWAELFNWLFSKN